MRRLHPRHAATVLQLRRYHEDGWAGSFDPDPVDVRAQVEHTRQIVVDTDGVRVVTVLTIRVPARTDGTGPLPVDYPTGSEVTLDGETSWVLSVRPVRWQGAVAYLELTTGERRPAFGGWLVIDAALDRTGGRDPKAYPLPTVDVPIPQAVFRPVSSVDVDRNQDPETTAEMILPPGGPAVTSTDRVRVPAGNPMAGRYQVVGDPAPHPTRTVVQLRRL